jgi:hypothetical protein
LLSNVIRNNHTLQQIFLSDNSITDEGSRLFCDAMQFQSSIVYLGVLSGVGIRIVVSFLSLTALFVQTCPTTTLRRRVLDIST